jgi:hypothetical protein
VLISTLPDTGLYWAAFCVLGTIVIVILVTVFRRNLYTKSQSKCKQNKSLRRNRRSNEQKQTMVTVTSDLNNSESNSSTSSRNRSVPALRKTKSDLERSRVAGFEPRSDSPRPPGQGAKSAPFLNLRCVTMGRLGGTIPKSNFQRTQNWWMVKNV